MNEKENSLRTIFVEAVEISDAAERDAFLQRSCRNDAVLRERVGRLIKAHADVERSATTEILATTHSPISEKPGDRIGRYKLREQIGEGGCGVVYVAEQEEPVRRRVALKVIKLGMDTRQVVARFEAERQALALMDHPNIAKVLDAGATNTGRPYFVMELVRGIRITDYCDQNTLSSAQRLELFIQVCHAIQHAHQKGIIHRDIKPSNILVTLHDNVPVPKVIDFGIAKATEGRLTDATLYTELHQFIGTPAYMSPEQAEMSGLDIDTRSDIYSLGVLLYELLTGRTPFDGKLLMQSGLAEMRRTIRDEEAVKPSTRLRTLAAAELTEVARRRQEEAPKLIHVLRGDLDWVVMKCLDKDRARRYETVNGLAMDVERHLENEPVVARPPTTFYRFNKLVRRNKLVFVASGAVSVALITGLGLSTWLFVRERQALKGAEVSATHARIEAAKATAISELLQEMLRSANPDDAKGSDYTVRQLLDDFSVGLEGQLAGQPEVEGSLRATIGRAYRRLGLPQQAEPHLKRAIELRRREFGPQHEKVAESLVDYAWNLCENGRDAEAEAFVREALQIYRTRQVEGKPVIHALRALLHVLVRVGGRINEAEAVVMEALQLGSKLEKEDPETAILLHRLGDVKIKQRKYAEAEKWARQALEMHLRLHGAAHPETGWGYRTLGVALYSQEKFDEAEPPLRESLRIFRAAYNPDHRAITLIHSDLEKVLTAQVGMVPAASKARLRQALQRLVQLYEDTNRPDRAAEWKRKLTDIDQTASPK